jgi:hypothetical protein
VKTEQTASKKRIERRALGMTIDGREHKAPAYINPGALSGTAHSLLGLMKREWDRPLQPEEPSVAPLAKQQCSQPVLVVILFWTLFEHLMDQFFRTALNQLPQGVGVDLLRRYQSIGSRMDRLYSRWLISYSPTRQHQ